MARPGTVVWYEPSSAGVRLGWAHFTGVTPGPSHCGAAQSLCAHNACELALTHLVIYRGEARPSAVVCRGKTGVHFEETSLCLFISSRNMMQNSNVFGSQLNMPTKNCKKVNFVKCFNKNCEKDSWSQC